MNPTKDQEMEKTSTDTKIKWGIDPAHSEVSFKVKHLMITNVKGVFNEFDASIYTTGEDFMTAEIDFWMNPASVDTNDAKRDGHLKSADFFDVENYKQITFLERSLQDFNLISLPCGINFGIRFHKV